MKAHYKSILIVVSTLVVGVLLGASGASVLQNRRAAKLQQARETGGLIRIVEKIVAIEDDQQRARIHEIVRDAEQKFREARTECSELLRTQRTSMITRLNAELTPEQREEFEQWLQRERQEPRRHGRRNGRRQQKPGEELP